MRCRLRSSDPSAACASSRARLRSLTEPAPRLGLDHYGRRRRTPRCSRRTPIVAKMTPATVPRAAAGPAPSPKISASARKPQISPKLPAYRNQRTTGLLGTPTSSASGRLRLKPFPVPMRQREPRWNDGVLGRVGHHVVDCPAHVRPHRRAKVRVRGQPCVVQRMNEAVEEPLAEVAHAAVPGMEREDLGLVPTARGIAG